MLYEQWSDSQIRNEGEHIIGQATWGIRALQPTTLHLKARRQIYAGLY